jgi:methionine-rich copper-binding protein CopC
MTPSLANIVNTARRGALAATLLVTAQMAMAHAMPKQQSPAPDSTVEAPHEAAIDFSEALEPSFSSLTVVDAAGKQVNSAKSVVDSSNKKHMSVALGDLKAGTYQVEWTAVADDGHRTQGHYLFNVK